MMTGAIGKCLSGSKQSEVGDGWGANLFPLQEMHQLQALLLRGPLRRSTSSVTFALASGSPDRRNELSQTPPLFRGTARPHPWNPCSLLCRFPTSWINSEEDSRKIPGDLWVLASMASIPHPALQLSPSFFLPPHSLTKRTPKALPSASSQPPPLLWSPQAVMGGS